MRKLTPYFIVILGCLSVYSRQSIAFSFPNLTSQNQCFVDVPFFNHPVIQGDTISLPINVSSNSLELDLPNRAEYEGNVLVEQGNRTIQSNKMIIDQSKKKNIVSNGNTIYQDNLVKIKSQRAKIDLETNNVQLTNSQYHLVGRLGRGSAESINFKDDRYLVLNDGSFTACPADDSSWSINGTKITHDNKEDLLKINNAIFKIGSVPVLYSPYFQIPTGNKRRSGLLMPNFSYSSTDGFVFSAPFYWNIAPNYDATITPKLFSSRGVQLQTEMRYLNEIGLGTIAFDWLQHDAIYNKNRTKSTSSGYSENDYRWLFHWNNYKFFNDNWYYSVDTTRVSDNQYTNDFDTDYTSQTDGYLTQKYKIGYRDENWDIDMNYRYFQVLRDELREDLYRTTPQLNANYYNQFNNLNFTAFGQVSRFVSSGKYNPKAWRFHIEPTIGYTLSSSWASLTTETGLLATKYQQEFTDNTSNRNLNKTVNRVLPKLSIDSKMIFERNVDFLTGYTETLEPRIKYIYIPYRDQSYIYNYDSSLLQSDYIGLFRDNLFSGIDRIASANKMTMGITSRFYDENKVEKFNFSFGQIYHFDKSKTGDAQSTLEKNKKTDSITLAGDTYWRINDSAIFRSGIQYDSDINQVSLANAVIEYRKSENKLVQMSYRYANKNYIDGIGIQTYSTLYKKSVNQVGIISAWPFNDKINLVGSVFYDINSKHESINSIGLNYSDCCWGVTLRYGRQITDWDSSSQQSQYENKLSINFELRGLSESHSPTAKMLNEGLLPYKTIFE